jgi:hypothetical protein
MQIALVAVVLLAGMWFTVLRPKPDAGAPAPVAATPAADASSAPVAPGAKGLASAVDKAKAASATSDAANAKLQAATAGPSTAAKPAAAAKAKAVAKPVAAARKPGTKAATAQAVAAKPPTAATVDPSKRLLAHLAKGKTLVILFYGDGADDAAARKAVHRTALKDSKNVVSAYVPISQVGRYDAITREVNVMTFPTVLVIGADRKATPLTGFLDTRTIQQAVGDSRRDDAAAAKSSK